jgi:VIT1/CCC1 family predicted Fe2+/Mn2+ transporter
MEPSDPHLSPEDQRTKQMLPMLTQLAASLGRRPGRTVSAHTHEHLEQSTGAQSGTFRAGIFGVSDGLVSNVSLIMGVAGAGAENRFILLAGLAGLLAGAFSMGAGEYISMKAQREVFERLITLERHELELFPDEELRELAVIYQDKGIPADLALKVATAVAQDPVVALDTHAREELGLDPEEGLGSPWGAAAASFLMFAFGAAVPLVPFLFVSGPTGVVASAIASAFVLFVVGAGISVLTGRSLLASGMRQVGVGALASVITFSVGSILGVGAVG